MTTLDAGEASKTIVRDTIRDGLRAAADDPDAVLDDPRSDRDGSRFALTSYPNRNVEYPHIVVREIGVSGGRRDSRVDLWQSDLSVRIELLGRSATEAMNLRDGVRAWFQASFEELHGAGWVDVSLDSSTGMNWERDPDVSAKQLTYSGTVYTE